MVKMQFTELSGSAVTVTVSCKHLRVERNLSYRQVECVRCDALRIAGVACPECGGRPDPREVDAGLQRRQREVAAALLVVDSVSPEETPPPWMGSPSKLYGSLETWLEGFMEAVETAGTVTPCNPAECDLVKSSKEFLEIRSLASSARRLRPWIAAWSGLDEILLTSEKIVLSYLTALSASVPIEAQRAAEEGQVALDAVAAQASLLSARLERAGRLEASTPTETLRSLSTEAARTTGGDLFALDRSGQHLYTDVTGGTDCPTGIGATLALTDLVIDVMMNRDRFWEVVRSTFGVLTSNARFDQVVGMSTWREDFLDATQRLFDSFIAQHAVTAVATRDRDHVRAALTLAQDLIEGTTKRYVATVLAAVGGQGYERNRYQDAGALLNRAEQAGLSWMLEGLQHGLRNARAHESYEINVSSVAIIRKGNVSETLSFEELADAVLAALESTFAIQTAITLVCASSGNPAESLDPLAALDIDATVKVEFVLAMTGWSDVSVEIGDDFLRVGGSFPALGPRSLIQAPMILPYLSERCHRVEFHSHPNCRVLTGPLEPLRRFQSATSEFEKGAALMEVARRWVLDGSAVVECGHVRKWSAVEALRLLTREPTERGRGLRTLRELASRLGDGELDENLARLYAYVRNRELGLSARPAEVEAHNWFVAWAGRQLPNPFE